MNEPLRTPRSLNAKSKVDRFTVISWVLTILIVAGLLGSALLYKSSLPTTYIQAAQPTNPAGVSGTGQPQVGVPIVGVEGSGISSIFRDLQLKTIIPERPRYQAIHYRVSRGDAMLSIAEQFKIKYESILYINKQLDDNPHSLKPGMELIIPPVDGLYYEWKDGDTFETVAEKFDANADDII
ncbi:MAG: LysM domain-containing protein, partial [Anaerolineales bacterium]|nr:LysM domain-containing protein [Anaerolineales bacterium]